MGIYEQIERDEGFVARPRQDTLGHWFVGFGWDLCHGPPLDRDIARMILRDHVAMVVADLRNRLPWTMELSQPRFAALINMGYQLGINGLLGFRKMLGAMQAGDFGQAAREAIDSEWAKQTPERAKRIAAQIERGEWV